MRLPRPLRVQSPTSTEAEYELLPFQFMSLDTRRVLLVSEFGNYCVLSREAFESLVTHGLPQSSPEFATLERSLMVAPKLTSQHTEFLAHRYRLKKSFLAGFTKLHIFVITLRCDHS